VAENNNARAWAQIPMQDWLFEAWKAYAEFKGMDQRMVLDMFVRDYIERKRLYTEEQHVVFYAPSHKAKGRTVTIDADLYKETELFSIEHETRINRVLMSAVLEGLKRLRRIKI
jgi:hypothetical protein